MLSTNSDSFISSFPICVRLLVFLAVALARTFSLTLNRSDGCMAVVVPVLFPSERESAPSFTIKYGASCRAFYQVEEALFYFYEWFAESTHFRFQKALSRDQQTLGGRGNTASSMEVQILVLLNTSAITSFSEISNSCSMYPVHILLLNSVRDRVSMCLLHLIQT